VHVDSLQVSLPPVRQFKAKSHGTPVAVAVVEVASIEPGRREVDRVPVREVVQRVNAAMCFRPSLPDLEMKVRIGGIFLADGPDYVALLDAGAGDDVVDGAVQMEIDEIQVICAIGRINHSQDDVRRAEALSRAGPVGRPGLMD
jgi:hypothetical protein